MMCGMTTTLAPVQLTADSVAPPASSGFTIISPDKNSSRGAIRTFSLAGPAGRLEAVLNEGASDAPFAALVCHPHPLYGGNLHNKVVYHAMKALNDPNWGLGFPVLRFNFRGAGLSEGTHDGNAEAGDVLAALDWLYREFRRPLVVAGFSFGAAMALQACRRSPASHGSIPQLPDVRALIALGLPTQIDSPAYRYPFLHEVTVPKLFLSGICDPFASPDQLSQIAAAAAEPKQLILLPGADHFFSGHLEPMQSALAGWVKEQLQ